MMIWLPYGQIHIMRSMTIHGITVAAASAAVVVADAVVAV